MAEVNTILRPRPPPSQTDTVLQASQLTVPKRPTAQKEKSQRSRKANCLPVKKEKGVKTVDRKKRYSERASEGGGGDHIFDAGPAQRIEVCRVAVSRAPGYAGLDRNIRMGPDVIHNCVEATPLLLWTPKNVSLLDFTGLLEKDSEEIVPMSPRESEVLESELFQATVGELPMSWSANLTALEEEEFKSEGAFIGNVRIAHTLQLETDQVDKHAIHQVKVEQKDGKFITKEKVRVILTESPTEFHLTLNGKLVASVNAENYTKTHANNKRYQKLCETILVSDAYVDRCSQTFLEGERDKSTQANAIEVVDAGEFCNEYLIQDEYARMQEMEIRKRIKDKEDAMMKAERDSEATEEVKRASSDEDSDIDDDGKIRSAVDWARLEEEEREEEVEPPLDISDDEFDMESGDEFELDMDLDELYKMREEKKATTPPKFLPDIKPQLELLEKLVTANRSRLRPPDSENPFKEFKNKADCAKITSTVIVQGSNKDKAKVSDSKPN